MSTPSITTNNNLCCIHSNHLFAYPLCADQSLLKKISNVAFHILTVGIPLAVYTITSFCYTKVSSLVKNVNLQATGVNSVLQNKEIKPYSVLGQEALAFARKKLEEHPDIKPFRFSAGSRGYNNTHQPVNPEIALLTTLYYDIFFKNFEDLMKQNKENPSINQDVINAADALMKIAYAISNLTLDDLKSFRDKLSVKGVKRTYAKALTEQDSYQYRTFYFCTSIYHYLRGQFRWSQDPQNNEREILRFAGYPSASHVTPFYQKGTIQNSWNRLYNEYCDRVRLYVDEEQLRLADSRYFNWTKKDTGVTTFTSIPDTRPI